MDRGNIIGEDLKPFLIEEIKKRQKIHGRAYNSPNRTPDEINYLSNRNAWIKMGSSVIITDKSELVNKKFQKSGYSEITGMKLTEENGYLGVIHNLNSDKGVPNRSTFNLMNETGIDKKDGLKKYGHVPPPGIESFDIKTLNRGSIRKGTLKMKAFSKAQFDVIDFLYFRPGFTVMVEWGWGTGIDSNGKGYEWPRKTILDDFWWDDKSANVSHLYMINKINGLREFFEGNYDGFFGKISNFEWTLGKDGTYDITLSLISMGDVIESLNLNISPQYSINTDNSSSSTSGSFDVTTTDDKETTDSSTFENKPALYINGDGAFLSDSSIVKGASSTKLCNMLYLSIRDEYHKDSDEYYSLKYNVPSEYIDTAIDDRYNYYITFRGLMDLIETYMIPNITDKNGKKLDGLLHFDIEISSDDSKIMIPLFPNQMAFDPRVCLFENRDTIGYNDIEGVRYLPLGISEDGLNGNKNQKFTVIKDNEPNLRYGVLPLLFINYDFISKCLLEQRDEKGNVNLYSFLKKLCDGINLSLGGVNQIEPVIKEDKIITFIDKTSIPGNKKIRQKEGLDKEEYEIDLWGYNTKNETKTSNFVKDFSFVTKITPQMSSQISIGVTAAGSSTSIIEGTIFENWNAGLKDKFNQYSIDPAPFEEGKSGNDNKSMFIKQFKDIENRTKQISTYDQRKKEGEYDKYEYKDNYYSDYTLALDILYQFTKNVFKQGYDFITKRDEIIVGEGNTQKSVDRKEIIEKAENEAVKMYNKIKTTFVQNDYKSYLIEAFGGDPYNSPEATQAVEKELGTDSTAKIKQIEKKRTEAEEREERAQEITQENTSDSKL